MAFDLCLGRGDRVDWDKGSFDGADVSWLSDRLNNGFKVKKTWSFAWTGYDVKGGVTMLDNIKIKVFKFFLEKAGGKYLTSGYAKMTGYKTQVFFGLGIAIALAEFFGYIPPEAAAQMKEQFRVSPEELASAGIGAGIISFMQKLKRYEKDILDFKEDVIK